MTIGEFLRSPARRHHASMPEMDTLADLDALQEADLVDVWFDGRDSSVAVLLDLRVSLQFRLANTAVLVCRGIEELHWARREPREPPRPHPVMSSKPAVDQNRFTLELVCLGGWRFAAISSTAEFFAGNVPRLPAAQPNLVEDDEQTTIDAMPAWDSPFEPKWASFFDRVEPQGL